MLAALSLNLWLLIPKDCEFLIELDEVLVIAWVECIGVEIGKRCTLGSREDIVNAEEALELIEANYGECVIFVDLKSVDLADKLVSLLLRFHA